MMMASKSYEKHPAHKAFYDALIQSLFVDEDDMDKVTAAADPSTQVKRKHDDQDEDPTIGSDQGKEKKRLRKDTQPSKKSSASKESSKDNAPKNNWFKQPPRPPTPDPEWNKCQSVDDQLEKTWFNDLVSAEKDSLTFDELMTTPINFSKFTENRLKLDKITKADLVGPVYKLLNASTFERSPRSSNHPCRTLLQQRSLISKVKKLGKEVYHVDHKDKGYKVELVGIEDMIPKQWSVVKVDYNKDVAFGISHWGPKRQMFYRSQINKLSRHDVYSTLKILSVFSMMVDKKFGYGYLEEIVDMLLLVVQHKLFHLNGDVIVDLAVALRMFTKRIVIQKRVEDVQLGRLMRADELYKFSDRTLKSVRDTLHHRLLNFRLGYNKGMPRRKWSAMGQRRSGIMVNLMDKKLLKRRIMQNLERLVGARELGADYRLMQVILHSIHSNDGNPTSANIQQALQQEKHEEATTSYADLKMEITGFHDATYRSNDNTNTTLRNNEKILAQFKTQNVLINLKEVHEAFKEDHALNKKVIDATEAYTKNLSSLTKLLTLNDHLAKWAESFASMAWSTDTADIKAMMTTILCAFRGQPFFAPSGSVPMPTLALTGILATVGGRAEEKKETPSHTKGEQADMVTEEHMEEKEVDGKIIQILNDQLQEYLDKKEMMDRAMKEAQLTKPVIKKVAAEIISETEVHIKGTKDFIKHQNAHFKVLTRGHSGEALVKMALRKKRNNEPGNFDVQRNFKFGDFSISEWDELSIIILKKKNKMVSELMTSLSNKYERLKQILGELGISLSLPISKQDISLPRRKGKAIELEPETYIDGLHCHRELPEGVKFVNNLVIKEHEHRFSMLMIQMINERPEKDRIMSKRVNLESLGYTDV
ncbi:hypothetical protein Tco_1165292 [Tanacetum coccineum]